MPPTPKHGGSCSCGKAMLLMTGRGRDLVGLGTGQGVRLGHFLWTNHSWKSTKSQIYLESTVRVFGTQPRPTCNVRCPACPQAPGCPHHHHRHPELTTAFVFASPPRATPLLAPPPTPPRPTLGSSGKLRQCAGGRVLNGVLASSPPVLPSTCCVTAPLDSVSSPVKRGDMGRFRA